MTKVKENSQSPAESGKSRNVATFDVDALLGLPAQATSNELLDLGVQAFNHSGQWMTRAGRCFQRLKESLPHGDFESALEARGIQYDHANRAMKLSQCIERLPEPQAKSLMNAPYTKVLAIAQADQEVIDDLIANGEFGELGVLSVRELRTKLKKLEQQNVTLETRLESKAAQYEKLQGHLQHRHDHLQMPEFAAVTREESAALTEKMLACLNSLQDLAKVNLFVERDEPEAEKFQNKVAATLYFTLLPIVAQGEALLLELQGVYPSIEAGVTFESQLTKPEAKHYLKARAAILEDHAREAKNRDAERENAKPGKRGRKRAVEA